MPHLHEPSILYTLEQRYNEGDIYTYTGPILIAVNPFKQLPLYTAATLEMYYNHGLAKSQGLESGLPLAPHVYAIADDAYRGMMSALFDRNSDVANQSVLISGESGAGKTESTKIVLRYLTALGNDRSEGSVFDVSTGSIMDQILQSNPILEAFGNARTLRNDNSSRFGKYIQLHFNRRGNLTGGVISTYLLEKVRLPAQNKGERNFHIFYQLFAGLSADEKAAVFLDKSIEDYWYTQQGEIYHLDSIDDANDFKQLRQALITLNFTSEHRQEIVSCTAAILHLGQISFARVHAAGHEEDSCAVSTDEEVQESFSRACTLLGVDLKELERILTEKEYFIGGQTFHRPFTVSQAGDARDAVTKGIYGRLFNWLVKVINKTIEVETKNVMARIGVLDIFGFECFDNNSFEQLNINYTNESLQQQFNQYVFKMEQEVYKNEQIEWSFIEFPDNQDCLDLIEHRQHGIFALLNDECKLPKASDTKLASRMYAALKDHDRFSASNTQQRDGTFQIRHYAGPVVYSVNRFVEKNRDDVPKELESLFQQSNCSLLAEIFGDNGEEEEEEAASRDSKRRTSVFFTPTGKSSGDGIKAGKRTKTSSNSVSADFKSQLHSLLERIYTTKPHYIRCLKPNDENVAEKFNRRRTTEQLRYGGVLEAVRVARSGYPVRLTHADFYKRYNLLVSHRALKSGGPDDVTVVSRDFCTEFMALLQATVASEEGLGLSVQIGVSKVFMRKNAHDNLESKRSRRMVHAACSIQALARAMSLRLIFKLKRAATRLIQRAYRGSVARAMVATMRAEHTALRIQTWWRTSIQQLKFRMIFMAAILIQRVSRGIGARNKVNAAHLFLHRVARVQNHWRVRCAKRIFLAKRAEAKSVGRLQDNNEALQREIQALKAYAIEETRNALEVAFVDGAQTKDALIKKLTSELESTKGLLDEEHTLRIAAEAARDEATLRIQSLTNDASSISIAVGGGDVLPPPLPIQRTTSASSSRLSSGRRPSLNEVSDKLVASATSPRPMSTVIQQQEQSELEKLLEDERALRTNLENELATLRAKQINDDANFSAASRTATDSVPSSTTNVGERRKTPVFGKGHLLKGNGGVVVRRGSKVAESPTPRAPSAGMQLHDEDNKRASIIAYQKNIDQFKLILGRGQRAHVYEDNVVSRDATVVYSSPNTLIFKPAKPSWIFFSAPVSVRNIKISDIIEVTAGARSGQSHSMTAADDARCLNIDVHVQFEAPRTVIFKLTDRTERNKILTALRSLMKDSQMNVPVAAPSLLLKTPAKNLFDAEKQPTGNLSAVVKDGGAPTNRVTDSPVSLKDATTPTPTHMSPHDTSSFKYQKAVLLLREQEEELTRMRKREAEYERDARVRVQLSRRLEQVLLDRQDLKDELENLKRQKYM